MKSLIFFCAFLLGFYSIGSNAASDPFSLEMILARIKPVGEVSIAGVQPPASLVAANTAPPKDAKSIYDKYCVVCHAAGIAGAPKLGDNAAWQPRITKGMDTLLMHVTNGFNAMPPKGTCAECSQADLKAAIDYMVKQAK